MSSESRLAKLQADGEGADPASRPLFICFGCDDMTDPRWRPAKRGDDMLCLSAGDAVPDWVTADRSCVFIPATQPICVFRVADGEEYTAHGRPCPKTPRC